MFALAGRIHNKQNENARGWCIWDAGKISKNLWKDIQLNGYLSNFTFQRIEITRLHGGPVGVMAWSVHGSPSTTSYMENINSLKRLRNVGTPILWRRTKILAKSPLSGYKVSVPVAKLCDCFSFKNILFTSLDKNILSFVLESASRYKAKSPEGFYLARSKYNWTQSYSLKYLKIVWREI